MRESVSEQHSYLYKILNTSFNYLRYLILLIKSRKRCKRQKIKIKKIENKVEKVENKVEKIENKVEKVENKYLNK